ncbi:MAG: Lon protease family protein [Syntrophomonadaceae bacterium]
MLNTNKYKLKPKDLYKICNPELFKFDSTADIKPLKGIIGQDRAVRSLLFGLDMDYQGYNIYLSGAYGIGKTTLARDQVEKMAGCRPVPSDWCYVFNFNKPDSPRAIELPAGLGKQFKKDIAQQVDKVIKKTFKALEGETFEYKRNNINAQFMEQTNALYLQVEEQARQMGFAISRSEQGINSIPLRDGEVLSQEAYMSLSEHERAEIMRKSAIVQEKINEAFRQYKDMEKMIKERYRQLEQETARSEATPNFTYLFDRYRDHRQIIEYIQELQQDLLTNIETFVKQDDNNPWSFLRHGDRRSLLNRYQVNLMVDNSELQHAPVIFDTNPTYANLFGQIEYESEFGILATDFSKIKAGSIHRANGGYLILHMYDLAKNYYAWDTLKRVLKNNEITVESVSRMFGISNSETLQPEPIPVNIKVIIIGEPFYYYLLYNQDEEFQKLFKIKADFDVDMERSRSHMNEYAQFITSVCEEENLRHFDRGAVARVVEYGSRMVDHQNKLSTQFNKLVEIIYEANYWAKKDNSNLVEEKHVKNAIKEKRYRSAMIEERIQEQIKRQMLMIDIYGHKTGQINGLAVYEMGEHLFGRPVRITAKTFMGESGLVNIEREIRMSGSIHSKGVLTLNGYMGAQYAQDKPLSLTASLTFEQSYQGIEGDSASSAELYALLSSLAGVNIYQGIAVTGSVNQNGEIQPVGGVNQKIEGYFQVCKAQGLDGKQGVIIPRQNIINLMLDEEIVEAVRAKKFHIWTVEHIDEGLEILTGLPAGKADHQGKYPPESVHGLVNARLIEWSALKRSERNGSLRNKYHGKKRRRG